MASPSPERRDGTVDNSLRTEERQRVRDELDARLRHRGASITGSESDDEILALANAVDAFERAVMQSGGDLMVDTPESSRPDNPDFVLPQRYGDEDVDAYIRRIQQTAERIGRER